MFSTDYPHWHADGPADALRDLPLPEELKRKLLAENARAFYRL